MKNNKKAVLSNANAGVWAGIQDENNLYIVNFYFKAFTGKEISGMADPLAEPDTPTVGDLYLVGRDIEETEFWGVTGINQDDILEYTAGGWVIYSDTLFTLFVDIAEQTAELNQEKEDRQAADNLLQAQITEEAQSRNAADLLKANLDSPALTGIPTAPTAASATNNTQLATTAFVKAVVDDLINGAPGTADTLLELFNEIQNNDSAIDALNSAIANKTNTNGSNISDAAAFRTALGLQALAILATVGAAQIDNGAIGYDKVASDLKDINVLATNTANWSFTGYGINEVTINTNITVAFINLLLNKSIAVTLTVTNGASVTWPAMVGTPVGDSIDSDGVYDIYCHCKKVTSGSEKVVVTIIKR